MNETSSQHEPPQTGESPSGFFPWLRSIGIERSTDDRWFTGVSAGIARKATIDPLIIRGVFVALTVLGGPGILLYLIAWFLLPDRTGKIHLEELIRGRASSAVTIVIVVFISWLVLSVFIGGLPSLAVWNWMIWPTIGVPSWVSTSIAWLFWISVFIGLGFIVHRLVLQHGRERAGQSAPGTPGTPDGRPRDSTQSTQNTERTQSTGNTGSAEAPGGPTTDWASDFSEKATAWGNTIGEKSTEWGNTVSQKADEWSSQYAERHDRIDMGTTQKLLTLAFALLAAGAVALWVYLADLQLSTQLTNDWSGVFVASVLAGTVVFALSMILAGIRGKRSGSIGFFGFVGVLTLIITAILPWGSQYRLIGNQHIEGAAPGSITLIGETYADLRALNSPSSNDTVEITQGLGNVELELPSSRKTVVHLSSFAGRFELASDSATSTRGGIFNQRTITVNEDGREPALTVYVRVFAGNIIVEGADDLAFAPLKEVRS